MPYRRLPKTDRARITALQKLVDMRHLPPDKQPVSPRLMLQAEAYLGKFKTLVLQYSDTYTIQVKSSKNYYKLLRKAKMYISHFIQVLNMAYTRGEIKKDYMKLYNLDVEKLSVPDLSTEAQVIEWGRNIIEGEKARTQKGGAPITFPTIALVQVNFEQFYEKYQSKELHHNTTSHNNKQVKQMHAEVDELILQLWDSIETFYADLLPYERMQACKNAGVIYYFRPREHRYTPEEDEAIRRAKAATQKLF